MAVLPENSKNEISKMTPKGSNWNRAAVATPFSLLDLESRDAISIPTAPTKPHDSQRLIEASGTNKEVGTN
jgi:hypothetical protein